MRRETTASPAAAPRSAPGSASTLRPLRPGRHKANAARFDVERFKARLRAVVNAARTDAAPVAPSVERFAA
jgi:hypothetical protein